MSRSIAVAVILATFALVSTVSAAPLAAGTANGPAPVASAAYSHGMHYPLGPGEPGGYHSANGSHPKPFNGTLPYSEWPDQAQVTGHKAAMTVDICVLGTKQRSTTPRRATPV